MVNPYVHHKGWFAKIFVVSVASVICIFILDCKYLFLPINGIYLFLYLMVVFAVSVWLTSTLVQNLLKQTRPLEYNVEKHKYLNYVYGYYKRWTDQSQQKVEVIPQLDVTVCDKPEDDVGKIENNGPDDMNGEVEEASCIDVNKEAEHTKQIELNKGPDNNNGIEIKVTECKETESEGTGNKKSENKKSEIKKSENKETGNKAAKLRLELTTSGPKPPDEIDAQVFEHPSIPRDSNPYTIDDRIHDFVTDIEEKFILSWYRHISDDNTFIFETHKLLDEVVRRFLQVVVQIDHRKLTLGILIIFLKHIKEFRKTVKRCKKNGSSIEESYRFSHPGSKSDKAYEHFALQLTTKLLKQFVSSDLWTSVVWRAVVSIVARKVTTYLINYMSQPGFLNYKTVYSCGNEEFKSQLDLKKTAYVSLSDVDLQQTIRSIPKEDEKKFEVKKHRLMTDSIDGGGGSTPRISPKRKQNGDPRGEGKSSRTDSRESGSKEESREQGSDTVDRARHKTDIDESKGAIKKTIDMMRSSTKELTKLNEGRITKDGSDGSSRAVSEPVKIYESSSAHNTWRNSSDLDCISLGEDILAFDDLADPDTQILNLMEKRLWKDNSSSVESEGKPQIEEKSQGEKSQADKSHGEKLQGERPQGGRPQKEKLKGESLQGEKSMDDKEEKQEEKHFIWNLHGEDDPPEIKGGVSPSANIHYSAAQIITNTMKPIGTVTANTIQNMKDFQQSTVNTVNSVVKPISQVTSNAKHKIGDLQDEAAGVMEGIFDFGMAGLRKGLRLTGLQENISDLTQKSKQEIHKIQKSFDAKATDVLKNIEMATKNDMSKMETSKMETSKIEISKMEGKPHRTPRLIKLSHITSDDSRSEDKTSSNDSDENIWLNPLNSKESPTFDGPILLERTPSSPRSFSQDVTKKLAKEDPPKFKDIPQIAMEVGSIHTSPVLEYEDTTDLATTTAKLRSLLQSRSSESNITTPALSPMPQDENVKITTPLEPDLNDVDGVMPSLYKFYNKTATGIQNTFNTIKTALPGSEKTPEAPPVEKMQNWIFQAMPEETNECLVKIKRLLHERRDFCTVDPAYDYLELMDNFDGAMFNSDIVIDDELDEFDIKVPITKILLDIICELVADTNSALTQEPIVKSILILAGKKSEDTINDLSISLIKNIKNLIGKLPQGQNDSVLAMKLDEMVDMCLNQIPRYLKLILGNDTMESALKLLITSFQSPKINRDLSMQLFQVITAQIIQANNLMSPAYSA